MAQANGKPHSVPTVPGANGENPKPNPVAIHSTQLFRGFASVLSIGLRTSQGWRFVADDVIGQGAVLSIFAARMKSFSLRPPMA